MNDDDDRYERNFHYEGTSALKDVLSEDRPRGMKWTSNDATLEIARADSLFRVLSKVRIFSSTPTTSLQPSLYPPFSVAIVVVIITVTTVTTAVPRRRTSLSRRAFHISVTVSPRDLLVHILDGLARCGTATVLPVVAKSNDSDDGATTTTTTTTSMTTLMFAIVTEKRI